MLLSEMATENANSTSPPINDSNIGGLMSPKCFKKALELPMVDAASSTVGNIYHRVKTFNKFSKFGFRVFEGSVGLVARRVVPLVHTPLAAMDNMACSALDGVKDRFPVVLRTPEEIAESGKDVVLKNGLVRASIYCADKILAVIESVVTVAPVVAARTVSDARGSLQKLYCASANHVSPDAQQRKIVSPKKRISKQGLVDRIFSIPRRLLRFLGVLACHHQKLNASNELVEEITGSSTSNSEDRKRKVPEEDGDLNELINKSYESYKSEEDADYEPLADDESVDSLEYRSGSVTDDANVSVENGQPNRTSSPILEENTKATETVNNCVDGETNEVSERHDEYAANEENS